MIKDSIYFLPGLKHVIKSIFSDLIQTEEGKKPHKNKNFVFLVKFLQVKLNYCSSNWFLGLSRGSVYENENWKTSACEHV